MFCLWGVTFGIDIWRAVIRSKYRRFTINAYDQLVELVHNSATAPRRYRLYSTVYNHANTHLETLLRFSNWSMTVAIQRYQCQITIRWCLSKFIKLACGAGEFMGIYLLFIRILGLCKTRVPKALVYAHIGQFILCCRSEMKWGCIYRNQSKVDETPWP